ncbi:MAG: PAS domain S-box protein [Bacteroidales bacterium]
MSTQRNRKTEQPLTNKSDSVEFLPKFLQCLQKLIALNSDPRISFEETINRFIVFFSVCFENTAIGGIRIDTDEKTFKSNKFDLLPGYSCISSTAGNPVVTISVLPQKQEFANDFVQLASSITLLINSAKKLKNGYAEITGQPGGKLVLDEQYQNFFHNSHTVMLIIDPNDGQIVDANHAAELFYGWTRNEICNKKVFDINALSQKEIFAEMQLATIQYKNRFDFMHKLKNGDTKRVEVHSGPIRFNNQKYLYSIVHEASGSNPHEVEANGQVAKFKSLTESTKTIFWEFDLRTDSWIFISPQVKNILGFPVEYWVNLDSWASRIYEDDRAQTVEYCKVKSAQGKDHDLEYRFVKHNGEVAWIREEVIVIVNDNVPVRLRGIMMDITQRKVAEEKVKESEQKLDMIFKNLTVGVSLITTNMHAVNANPQMEKWFPGINVKKNPYCYSVFNIPPQDSPCNDCPVEKSFREGKTFETEKRSKTLEGDKFFRITSTPVTNDTGTVIAAIEMMEDITRRKMAEISLTESETKFRKLFETMEQGVIYYDSNGSLITANPATEKILGLSFDQLKKRFSSGKRLNAIFEDGLAVTNNLFPEIIVLNTGNPILNVEMGIYNTMKKEQRWIMVNAIPEFKDGKAKPFRVYTTLTDITERKKGIESMAHALKIEKELGELKTRFVTTVSHEFRTPLASIFSNTQLLQKYFTTWDNEKRNLSLQRIFDSVKLMTNLLDDVSLIGKEQSGKLTFKPEKIAIKEFVTLMASDAEQVSNEKGRVTVTISTNLRSVFMDKTLLRHIIINLLTNALKYSPHSTKVLLSVVKANNDIEFTVSDKGIGIPPDEIQHIFDPFYRASNCESYIGTGLGMSIVDRCVNTHGGNIKVTSTVNAGTTVLVKIPLGDKITI